jgi:hypothetical protein
MRLNHILAGAAVAVTLALGIASPAMATQIGFYETGSAADPSGYILVGYDGAGTVAGIDSYSFSISTDKILTATVTPNQLPSDSGLYFGFSSLTLGVEKLVGSTWESLSVANLGTTGIELAAGVYQLIVTGTTSGLLGGNYTGNAGLSPVPIPGAIVLFGSGLLGLVGFARRRTSAARAAA